MRQGSEDSKVRINEQVGHWAGGAQPHSELSTRLGSTHLGSVPKGQGSQVFIHWSG